jgi:UDP-N-acetylmuramate--alanine ligase
MDISRIKNIYMIGIKGVGMTMLAQFLFGKGYNLSGSDVKDKYLTDQVLEKMQIKVFENFDIKNIPGNIDLIIYSSAYNEKNNIELAAVLGSGKRF